MQNKSIPAVHEKVYRHHNRDEIWQRQTATTSYWIAEEVNKKSKSLPRELEKTLETVLGFVQSSSNARGHRGNSQFSGSRVSSVPSLHILTSSGQSQSGKAQQSSGSRPTDGPGPQSFTSAPQRTGSQGGNSQLLDGSRLTEDPSQHIFASSVQTRGSGQSGNAHLLSGSR